jgi:hypothetical protein
MSPGGPVSAPPRPEAPRPPNGQLPQRNRPSPINPTNRLLHWAVIAGGLVVISDLCMRLTITQFLQDQDTTAALTELNYFLNFIIYAVAGTLLGRETGRVGYAAAAGLLAGLFDALIVMSTNSLAPFPGADATMADSAVLFAQNIGTGVLAMTLSAAVATFAQRSKRGR